MVAFTWVCGATQWKGCWSVRCNSRTVGEKRTFVNWQNHEFLKEAKKNWMLSVFNENEGWANLKCKWTFWAKHDLLLEVKGQKTLVQRPYLKHQDICVCIIWLFRNERNINILKQGRRGMIVMHGANFRLRLNIEVIYSNSKVESRKPKSQQQAFQKTSLTYKECIVKITIK